MTVGFRHDDLRRRNRALVIAAIRHSGQVSRTDLARLTALSHSTISAISGDLISEQVLVEIRNEERSVARRGRPQVAMSLNPAAATVVTVVLVLDRLWVALLDYSGNVVAEEERRLPTQTISADDLVADMVAMVGGILGKADRPTDPARIALAIQGTTDAASRTMLWSPIAAGRDIAFADRLERAFGVPTTVENDCNMIAIALHRLRPDRYRNDFIAILLSHGIGMGMVRRGKLIMGTHSSGCEFGHMVLTPYGARCRCGRQGCVEAYAGNYAIHRAAGGAPADAAPAEGISNADMALLADRARRGEGPERAAFRQAGEAIGFGLGSLFALIDPSPVALVGHGARAFDLIEPALLDAISRTAGGRLAQAISFAIEPDETPLIRAGAALRALVFVDQEIMAPGQPALT